MTGRTIVSHYVQASKDGGTTWTEAAGPYPTREKARAEGLRLARFNKSIKFRLVARKKVLPR